MEKSLKKIPADFDFGGYSFEIIRKQVKHIYFKVYPLKKRITVTIPFYLDQADLERAIEARKDWLFRQIRRSSKKSVRLDKHYLSCERVWYKGRVYQPKFGHTKGRRRVEKIGDSRIHLLVRQTDGRKQVEELMTQWLRRDLKQVAEGLVEKWQPKLGVRVDECRIKKMKTRWGSCNIRAKRIWLNQSLIHLPPPYLEYVVVHEMVHLLERYHNSRFRELMDRYIPAWQRLKKQMDQYGY